MIRLRNRSEEAAPRSPHWNVKGQQKLLGLVIAFTIFTVAASISRPQNSSAQDAREKPSAGHKPAIQATAPAGAPDMTQRAPQRDALGRPLIGELFGAEHRIWIYADALGPLYTVCDPQGRILVSAMRPDDVYRDFPNIDIKSMTLEPAPGADPGPLMLAEPTN